MLCGWLVVDGQVTQSPLAEKVAKTVFFKAFLKNGPVGVLLGLLVCFLSHWRVNMSVLGAWQKS